MTVCKVQHLFGNYGSKVSNSRLVVVISIYYCIMCNCSQKHHWSLKKNLEIILVSDDIQNLAYKQGEMEVGLTRLVYLVTDWKLFCFKTLLVVLSVLINIILDAASLAGFYNYLLICASLIASKYTINFIYLPWSTARIFFPKLLTLHQADHYQSTFM